MASTPLSSATREAAFSPYQYDLVLSLCTRHSVQLWLPEIDGRVASGNAEHDRIMMELFWGMAPTPPLSRPAETAVATARMARAVVLDRRRAHLA
ncbi:hypothetical protein K1W54_13945 [Micromonospora sp. CPCC 205371]|nr:hypothetical protein [Micromonospora sp. CPCC 205371]